MLSFIIPAHNEETELPKTLAAIQAAAKAVGHPYELVVVNDTSTDRTAAIAETAGARVVNVNVRQISRARNAGAKASQGDILFFIDADTRLPETTLRAALAALDAGTVGGGAWVRFEQPVNPFVTAILVVFNFLYMRVLGWAAGCFLFARRKAFEAAGGFDETLFATEEIWLSRALKRQGRFVVLRETVTTSSRKVEKYLSGRTARLTFRFLLQGRTGFKKREGLDLWY